MMLSNLPCRDTQFTLEKKFTVKDVRNEHNQDTLCAVYGTRYAGACSTSYGLKFDRNQS